MSTMKEAIIHPNLQVTIEDAQIPTPKPDEVIIKIVFAGTNPIDWKGADEVSARAMHGDLENPLHKNAGKDMAGYVHSIGSKVFDFKLGDRVVAVNHSSGFAEYGVGPAHTTAHIPDGISFEEAATTGLAYITAALALYRHLPLPEPWNPAKEATPLVIYGASSAVGAFAVKLAVLSNIHPIIAIAGGGGDIIAPVLRADKGDILLDYRSGKEALVKSIRRVAPHVKYVFDSISNEETVELLTSVLEPNGSIYASSLGGSQLKIPAGIQLEIPFAPGLWEPYDPAGPEGPKSPNIAPRAFSHAFFGYLSFAWSEGLIKVHPHKVLPNGLASLEEGIKGLRDGKNHGLKYLYEIAATPGVAGRS
ncbi:Trans-enoyl reductase [Lachnellula suecica]|uniref:Trans-enoyl reductase n=1 Tax=Lachnellula suecica TaxID=602035 RepID=A0A8T9C348_9HELO|nr:Trans-enoyl reductase [Lachnellula suecica]